MKKILAVLLGATMTWMSVRADEGMWLLPLLNELNIKTMKGMGCELSAEDIYSINHSSLKDAIVIFGGGCTAEMVSPQGLLFTNHHCGYDAIQKHSSVEHDYLSEGFWARSQSEELYTPNLTVTFLVRIEDVSERINAALSDDMSEEERQEKIGELSSEIEHDAEDGTHYQAEVESFFGGNKFYLLVYEIYEDVRLVGAPPSSIGKFGADTDNWMWPRHTGDFSIFRVYAGPDGKPAEYSQDNVPLQPRHFLPISLKGVEKDDFTMVLGYPGSTNRYMTSYGVDELLEVELPSRVKIRGEKQEIMMRHMQANPAVRIKYASKYSRSSNYWKYSIGQSAGIKRLDVYGRKSDQEERFEQWLEADATRKAKYGDALKLIREGTEDNLLYNKVYLYLVECFTQGTELARFAMRYQTLYNFMNMEKPDPEIIKAISEMLWNDAAAFYKDYDQALDREVTEIVLKRYQEDIPDVYLPAFYQTIQKKYKGNISKYVDDWFKKSIFADPAKLDAFLQKPSKKVLEKDQVFLAGQSVLNMARAVSAQSSENDSKIEKGNRLYIAGVLEMDKDKVWYPDANFTMRLTYGKVGDYFPRDAVYYNYYKTMKGIMEKEYPNNWEFVVPDRLKELYETKDFGIYANKEGEMPVCFISNNDITGGNSGSPVINGKGHLLGLAFDGNWEAMSGDIVFEPAYQRTISVDIRYVLFIIDKYAGAQHLIEELTLVK